MVLATYIQAPFRSTGMFVKGSITVLLAGFDYPNGYKFFLLASLSRSDRLGRTLLFLIWSQFLMGCLVANRRSGILPLS